MYICEALIPLNPNISQLLSYCTAGFLIVMSVLLVQSLLAGLVGKILSQVEGAKADPSNFLLMHAMGPNVAGVIGTALVAGFFIATLAH